MTPPKALPLALSAAGALAAACGDDDDGDDLVSLVDAGPDAGSGSCLFELPDELPALTGLYFAPGQPGLELVAAGAFLDDAGEDLVEIGLYNGFGVFADGYATGSYEIAGAEADFYDCGVCVTIRAADGPNTWQFLMAESGTLDIATLEPEDGGRLQATLTGATLREITGDDATMTQTEVEGGCRVSLPTVEVDVTLATP